tara:strand:- start:3840 stop:5624 length:1785 start_codon:yes stop_codon:yes gene_type:complete
MALNGLIAANNLSDVVDIERTWDNIGSNISATVLVPSPTLDLNFAANKSLVDDISGNNLITFSRASTGTFVGSNGLIQTAASGVPRFDHNPATGESLGLLVEEARTNAQTNSTSASLFTPTELTITPNTLVAPDGTTTACSLIENSANSYKYAFNPVTFSVSGTTYSFSFYAKIIGNRTSVSVGGVSTAWGTGNATFNLSTVTATGSGGFTAAITEAGNGWYRCTATKLASASGYGLNFYLSTVVYQGDGSSGIGIWGIQAEASSFPTSYIPTVASTVTRSADVASMTGTNFSSWYNQSEGTLFANARSSGSSNSNFLAALNLTSAAGTVFADILEQSTTVRLSVYNSSSIYLVTPGTSGALAGSTRKAAIALKASNYGAALNGTASTSGTNATAPPVFDRLLIMNFPGFGTANGTISRLAYYPVRVSNITLQALTTLGPVSSFPYSFSIKGRDILALKEVNKVSTRDFVFIKGLSSKAQPRINTASRYTASGVALRNAAMPKVAPTTIGNYFFSSGLTLSGTTVQINGTNALSIATSPFSSSTATAPLLFAGLRPQANWRFSEAMTSGTVVSPEFAIPIETSDFLLFIKTGQS